jgi:hypothetical protein
MNIPRLSTIYDHIKLAFQEKNVVVKSRSKCQISEKKINNKINIKLEIDENELKNLKERIKSLPKVALHEKVDFVKKLNEDQRKLKQLSERIKKINSTKSQNCSMSMAMSIQDRKSDCQDVFLKLSNKQKKIRTKMNLDEFLENNSDEPTFYIDDPKIKLGTPKPKSFDYYNINGLFGVNSYEKVRVDLTEELITQLDRTYGSADGIRLINFLLIGSFDVFNGLVSDNWIANNKRLIGEMRLRVYRPLRTVPEIMKNVSLVEMSANLMHPSDYIDLTLPSG